AIAFVDGAPWAESRSSSQASSCAILDWRSSSSATARWARAETLSLARRARSSRSSGRLMFRRAIHTEYTPGWPGLCAFRFVLKALASRDPHGPGRGGNDPLRQLRALGVGPNLGGPCAPPGGSV